MGERVVGGRVRGICVHPCPSVVEQSLLFFSFRGLNFRIHRTRDRAFVLFVAFCRNLIRIAKLTTSAQQQEAGQLAGFFWPARGCATNHEPGGGETPSSRDLQWIEVRARRSLAPPSMALTHDGGEGGRRPGAGYLCSSASICGWTESSFLFAWLACFAV